MNILGHSQSLRLVISESSDTWNCIIPTLTQNTRYHSAIKGNKEEYFAQKNASLSFRISYNAIVNNREILLDYIKSLNIELWIMKFLPQHDLFVSYF